MGDDWKNAKSVYDFAYKDIDGVDQNMSKYEYVFLVYILISCHV